MGWGGGMGWDGMGWGVGWDGVGVGAAADLSICRHWHQPTLGVGICTSVCHFTCDASDLPGGWDGMGWGGDWGWVVRWGEVG